MTAVKTQIGGREVARDVLLSRVPGLTALQTQRAIEELVGLLGDISDQIDDLEGSTGIVNVKAFGAIGDGVTNDAAAFQAAFNHAATFTNAPPVYAPAGTYLINTTVSISKEGQLFYGAGMKSTVLKPGMSDGSACLRVTGGVDYWSLRDFGVITSISTANFTAGTADGQDCIGIEAYTTGDPFLARFSMSDLYVLGCATGYKIGGFIATLTNLHAQFCDLGFKGTLLNSVWANLRLEACRKSFEVDDSDALTFAQLLDEGAVANAVSATLDDCKGVTFENPYWEGAASAVRDEPFLTIGGTTECRSVSIVDAAVTGSGGMAADVYPLKFDRVDGLRFSGRIADGEGKHGIETTANTKNITQFTQWREFGTTQDASKGVDAPVNWFPNPRFDAWFRGWDASGPARATLTQETTLTRRGPNAVRLTATAGQNFNNFVWLQSEAATPLRGKTVRMGAWVWVPDIVEYAEDAWTAYPGIVVASFNGSDTVSSDSVNQKMINNAWNFLTAEVEVQADATRIELYIYANQSADNATGNEYIVVDSVSLVEASVPTELQMYGELVDSPYLPSFASGKMISYGTAQPNDTDQVYEVGDIVLKSDVAVHTGSGAAQSPGWVCTTAGAGGTAVFATLPNMTGPASATDSAIALYAGTTGGVLKNSVATINSTGIISGVRYLNSGLQILDTDQSHTMNFTIDALTGNRALTLNLGDANRSLTLSGNATLNDWFDQSVKVAASPQFAELNVGHVSDTTITRSAAGIIAVEGVDQVNLSASQTLTGKTIALGSNTVSGTTAQFNTALTDGDFATLAGAESLSNKTLVAPALGTPASGVLTNCTGYRESITIACSDESTNLTTGTAKVTFRMPYAFTLTGVRANVNTAPTGSTIIVDINENGSTIMAVTKLSIDASEKTSTTAASAAVLSDTTLADDAEITIDIDQVGSTIPGKGLKVTLLGFRP